MYGAQIPLAFGPLGSSPAILIVLAFLAATVLVGRFIMALAWKLIVIALIVLTTLWILGGLGFEFGIL